MEQTHTSHNGAAATPGAQRRVLVVEDDPTIVDAIAARLRAEGFLVQTAGDGPAAVDTAEAWQPDLLILDIMLPGFDGLEVCRRVQAQRPVPVLMLTARDDETDMLVGLGVGADDYMTKPFSMRELAARVHVLLRRVERAALAATTPRSGILRLGELEIDHAQRRVRVRSRGRPPHAHRVRPAGLPGQHPARGALPGAAAGRGVGLGGRLRHPDRRQPHQGAAPEDRRRADPHGARRGLRAGDADAMSRTGSRARGRPGDGPWGGVRPFSIKTKLGALVVISVLITTGLSMIAVHTKTELRFITVFSMIATLLITQFVAHSLTAPLDEMNAVARSISHGDYTRRVREDRRDELGDLAVTINRHGRRAGGAGPAAQGAGRERLARAAHPHRGAARGAGEHRRRRHRGRPGDHAHGAEADRAARPAGGDAARPLPPGQRRGPAAQARRFEVWPYLSGVLKEANMVASARAGIASGSGSHTRTDVHLHLDVSPPELTAHADPERIHQVVANLIDNAVKHSPPHGRVTVRARRGTRPESLELEVLDEGPGIPRSEWHRVFERFNRGEVTRPHGPGSDGGTGLGLAIARWAVDLHGGRIGVAESERGCRIHRHPSGRSPIDVRLT